MDDIREIWFRCSGCSREAYCGVEFDSFDDPQVMCPFCNRVMPLDEVRLDRRRPASGKAGKRNTETT